MMSTSIAAQAMAVPAEPVNDRVMAEAAPKAVRLTAPDIVDALRGNGLYEDSRAFQRLFPILEADARAIEVAVLRKNGIEVAE
jgi:hypothetical protein